MRSRAQERREAPSHRFFVPLNIEPDVYKKHLFEQRLFVMRVLETMSWTELWDIPLDEFEFLHSKAVEINDKVQEDIDELKK